MSLAPRDILVEFLKDLEPLDGHPGPEVPAEVTLEVARQITRTRLQSLRILGIQCLGRGEEVRAWRILDQCRDAVASFNLLCDAQEFQKHHQDLPS